LNLEKNKGEVNQMTDKHNLDDTEGSNIRFEDNNSQGKALDYSNLPVAKKPWLLRQTRGYSPGQKYDIPLPPPPPPAHGSNASKPKKE
jgi:hypothetical protein